LIKIILTKLSGIYQITNIINNKIYIGHSINLNFRWYHHLDSLLKNIHPNSKLQNDFNTYGISAFNFRILELVKGDKKELIAKEQEYLDTIDFNSNYNIINSKKINYKPNTLDFINFINSKWLVPNGVTEKEDLDKYKIYKAEDKQEIINKVIDCKLLNLCASKITFNKVIDLMENSLGYTIEGSRIKIKRKKYTYKLVIEFDEDKVTYESVTREI